MGAHYVRSLSAEDMIDAHASELKGAAGWPVVVIIKVAHRNLNYSTLLSLGRRVVRDSVGRCANEGQQSNAIMESIASTSVTIRCGTSRTDW
jgi:hypothetical protein